MPDVQGAADVVALTQALVRIPSENPVGTEAEIAAFVRDWLSALTSAEVEVREVFPGRFNVIARLPGSGNLPPLALLAHMDTVPFGEGWTLSPTSGEIREGKLYGRGSCDMKSGLAVAMHAFAAAAREGQRPHRTLLLCATVDEEGAYMRGANALVDDGIVDGETLVVATEPSNIEVMTAHKGLLWVEVEVTGKLAHAGNPGVGVDAIRVGAEFIHAMKREIDALPHRHATLGKAEITFSAFNGGIKTNVVPDHARIEMDIRLPPPMTIAGTLEIVARCAREAEGRVSGSSVTFRRFNNDRPPVEADENGPLVRALVESIRDVTGHPASCRSFRPIRMHRSCRHVPATLNCVVFGPVAWLRPIRSTSTCPSVRSRKLRRPLENSSSDCVFGPAS